MKFRDEDNLDIQVITSDSPIGLEHNIRILSKKYNLVDLQYSTTTYSNNTIQYSALALVRKK